MMKSPSEKPLKSFSRLIIAAVPLSFWLCTPAPLLGQSLGCVFVPDDRNPSEKILRCGSNLTIRSAPNTAYRVTNPDSRQPGGARLDSGALLIEFTPNEVQRDFRILTPQAITAVRGTRWAVEVRPRQTSTLVLSGSVEVTRRNRARESAVLGPGEGVDVSVGTDPLMVKRWAQTRIDALMARFGR